MDEEIGNGEKELNPYGQDLTTDPVKEYPLKK